jgi:hypothetical protein
MRGSRPFGNGGMGVRIALDADGSRGASGPRTEGAALAWSR